jgi:hypothetical protein
VKEAGSLKEDDVIKALDRAGIVEGPGGPAEMVPGQHHVRMNMYIGQASNGAFRIVKNLGVIDPDAECALATPALIDRNIRLARDLDPALGFQPHQLAELLRGHGFGFGALAFEKLAEFG